ncbi:MAG: histidine ammonia-lyase [Clostridiales bacterium]|nr:histidine ammonia-lyase [Clostridiales bacterium]
MQVVLNGRELTIEQVVAVAREGAKVALSSEARSAVNKAREYVDKKLSEKAVIYGLTTGFGKFSDIFISEEDTRVLQKNLIMSHSCGMGNPLPTEVVRAAMLLRCNALSRGNSGIRLETLQTLIDMINAGVHPQIPEKGSLGASGDLAPLSHIVLVMLGEGHAEYKGKILTGAQAMEKAKISTIELAAKEGLALINGTQIMTAIGALAVYDAVNLSKTADIIGAMTCEAQLGIKKAFDLKIHELRGHSGQKDSAQNLLVILRDSSLALDYNPDKVQDAYTIRCMPQIHGASRDAIDYVYNAVTREINAVTDNPIIFPDEDEVISGGNFHGQPIALALDFLGIALSEYADVSERRIERMVNPQLNNGLPAFLTKHSGVNSGFMIAQYSAASMVSENKIYAHPASVDSIPSSASQEDHVSMGTTAARTARMILDNSQNVLGIELFTAYQSLYLRGKEKLSSATRAVFDYIAQFVKPVEDDIVMHYELVKFDKMIKANEIVKVVEAVCGPLK